MLRPKPGYEKQVPPTELRTMQDWLVRRQLLGTPGVADVSCFGGLLKQYEIALDPERLRSLGVSVDEVYQAVAANNQNTGGAYIDKNPTAYFIRTEGLVDIAGRHGQHCGAAAPRAALPVLVRDVAQVRFGSAVRYGAMTRNGEGEVVGGAGADAQGRQRLRGHSSREDAHGHDCRKRCPRAWSIEPFLDRSELVDRAIGTVTKNLAEGALIVIFVLVLFLGNWRAGLVVASVIPLAMLFAISLMRLFGVSGNLMSLGAIDFGLIVDGAVIIVEAIVHRLHGGTAGRRTARLDSGRNGRRRYTRRPAKSAPRPRSAKSSS